MRLEIYYYISLV